METRAPSRPYRRPVLRDLGRMDRVTRKSWIKDGFKRDPGTRQETRLK